MLKKTNFKKILISSALIIPIFVFLTNTGYAQTSDNYTLLAPIPCVGGPDTCGNEVTETNFNNYIPGIFNLLIGISAAFAVLSLVWGGFQYLSTDAVSGKSSSKERIKSSLLGLVLVIVAWLILYTVNPELLDIKLDLTLEQVQAPFGDMGNLVGKYGPGIPISGQQIQEDKAIRDFLQSSPNIKVYADPCQGTQTSNCVNLNGLPEIAQVGLKNLALDCPKCNIIITGGTEGGHKTHGVGRPMVDLRSTDTNLNDYILENKTSVKPTSLGPEYTVKIGSQTAIFLKESNPPHWHVEFK